MVGECFFDNYIVHYIMKVVGSSPGVRSTSKLFWLPTPMLTGKSVCDTGCKRPFVWTFENGDPPHRYIAMS